NHLNATIKGLADSWFLKSIKGAIDVAGDATHTDIRLWYFVRRLAPKARTVREALTSVDNFIQGLTAENQVLLLAALAVVCAVRHEPSLAVTPSAYLADPTASWPA